MATVTQKNPRWRPLVWQTFLVLLALMFAGGEAFAQAQWEFSLQQRRMHDQIHVEVWAKARDTNVTRLGSMSLVLQYNADALTATTAVALATINRTDSVSSNLDQANPLVEIQSVLSSANGYQTITTASYGVYGSVGYHSLEVQRVAGTPAGTNIGFTPVSTGRGAFLGKVVFQIKANGSSTTDPTSADSTWNTGIQFGQSATAPGNVIVLAYTATNDTLVTHTTSNVANATFGPQPDFRVMGVTILNPAYSPAVVDRDKEYTGTTTAVLSAGDVRNNLTGYPIYFERSGYRMTGDPSGNSNRYLLEYTRDSLVSWNTLGRVAEGTTANATVTTVLLDYSNNNNNVFATQATLGNDGAGAILLAGAGTTWPNAVTIATLDVGTTEANRSVLRLVLGTNATYQFRSETAYFRLTRLSTTSTLALAPIRAERDTSAQFSVGRLFFLQFNGLTQYVKTDSLFSNATQLTAEAWVNLNQDFGAAANPGIIASSPGPDGQAGEGTWMLYLHQGRFPAFRAREIFGRGDGYVATVISPTPLTVVNSNPLSVAHQNNWVHVAATVSDDTVRLYVNGGIVAESINSLAPDIRMGVNGTPGIYPIWVGVNPNVTTPGAAIPATQYFPGGIKQAKVWRASIPGDSLIGFIPGVTSATTVGAVNSAALRKSLEMYFTFEGVNSDSAYDATFQNGRATATFFQSGAVVNEAVMPFRPDLPHLRIVAPQGCEGVTNTPGPSSDSSFTVRWVGFGVSGNVEVSYTTNATVYHPASSSSLGSSNLTAFSNSSLAWQPWQGSTLATISPYSFESVRIRVRGTGGDSVYTSLSEIFAVAPNFATRFNNSILKVQDGSRFVMNGQEMFLEAWIRPYQFPAVGQTMPIVRKADSTTGAVYYSLDLRHDGRLSFSIRDTSGVLRTALSADSLRHRIVGPNTVAIDSPWTHVGVYVNRGTASQSTKIVFYVDGNQQTDTSVTNQLGAAFVTADIDTRPLYIGYRPAVAGGDAAANFLGEMREVRYWRGRPNNSTVTGSEPTALTNYVRGALGLRARNITQDTNLVAAFSLDGGGFYRAGYFNVVGAKVRTGEALLEAGFSPATSGICYRPLRPFIKIVEPVLQQRVKTDASAITVRWVGLDYVTSATRTTDPLVETQFATNANTSPIEVSFLGGGGNVIQPYAFVTNATSGELAFSTSAATTYRFPHTNLGFTAGTGLQFAALLNPSISNPFTAGAALAGVQTNGRIRYRVTTATPSFIGSSIDSVIAESPLFTIVPPSNFTVRVLLEGYHTSASVEAIAQNLGTTYNTGGLRIKLYEDNNGQRGAFVTQAESEDGYYRFATAGSGVRDITSRTTAVVTNVSTFANVPFVFTNIADGNYWVVVEHRNHLPVMSRVAAEFAFSGDDVTTANIESGWDFTTWGGTTATAFASEITLANSTFGTSFGSNSWLANGYYSAFGSFVTNGSVNAEVFARTGLIFNTGRDATEANLGLVGGVPSLVAGDVEKGGGSANIINALDLQNVENNSGTANYQYDVTGDNTVNGTDRTIVGRNLGRVSSLLLETFVGGEASEGEESVVFSSMPENPSEQTLAQVLQFEDERFGSEIGTQPITMMSKFDGSVLASAGISFDIEAEPYQDGNELLVPVYITNTGSEFSMGNGTFAFNFDNNVIEIVGTVSQPTLYTGNGYSGVIHTPRANQTNQLPGIASLEVIYNNATRPVVPPVPTEKTLIGTLRFRILDRNQPIVLDWFRSTVVHQANGNILTGNFDFREGSGNFKPIPPVTITKAVTLTSPTCGDNISAGTTRNITWTSRNVEQINLEYSPNNGQTWVRINSQPVNAVTGSFAWTVPGTPSELYFVRVLEVGTNLELTRTACAFTVNGYAITFTNPAQGAVLGSCGADEIIRWTSINDNVKFARLEWFDGASWNILSQSIDIAQGSTTVKFPVQSVNNARLRVIDLQTFRVAGISEQFSLVCGNLEFITPAEAQRGRVGETMAIRWINNGLLNVDLQFSADNGSTWETIMSNVDATLRRAEWVPTKVSNLARLRATAPGQPNMVLAYSPRFVVDQPVSVGEGDDAVMSLLAPKPNPATTVTSLRFGLAQAANVSIEVFNAAGVKVMSVVDGVFYNAGSYTTNFSVEELGSGTYFVRFTAGERTLTQTLVVRK